MTKHDLEAYKNYKQFKQVGAFAANVPNLTQRSTVDAAGSSIDTIFAEAVLQSMPTLVVEQFNLMQVKEWDGQEDSVTFPVHKNFDLDWTNLSGTGSDTGSDLAITATNATTWRKITPILYGAGLFIHDMVDISVNKHNFDQYASRGGIAVQRFVDQTAITDGLLGIEDAWATGSNLYVAGGTSNNLTTGSISTASLLTPKNLIEGRKILRTGSDIYAADAVLMHPNQYYQLIVHTDFSETQSSEVRKFATWENGVLVKFDQMDVVVTELVPTGDVQAAAFKGYYTVGGNNIGRPVVILSKGITAALAKKSAGFAVHTVDDRLKHGSYKLFDVMFKSEPLVPESGVIIRCSD